MSIRPTRPSLTRLTASRLSALLIATAAIAAACTSPAPSATGTPSAPPVAPTEAPPTEQPRPTLAPGTATVETSGDVETTVMLPYDDETSEFPSGDGSFDLVWQDEEQNTLRVTLDMTGGEVDDAFVAVGVPGTGLDDEDYFADFLRTACEVEVSRADESAVEGTFDCPGLENGAGTKSVDVTGSFSAEP